MLSLQGVRPAISAFAASTGASRATLARAATATCWATVSLVEALTTTALRAVVPRATPAGWVTRR